LSQRTGLALARVGCFGLHDRCLVNLGFLDRAWRYNRPLLARLSCLLRLREFQTTSFGRDLLTKVSDHGVAIGADTGAAARFPSADTVLSETFPCVVVSDARYYGFTGATRLVRVLVCPDKATTISSKERKGIRDMSRRGAITTNALGSPERFYGQP
jgi:hypothetical protein